MAQALVVVVHADEMIPRLWTASPNSWFIHQSSLAILPAGSYSREAVGFAPGSVHMGVLVDKVALEKVSFPSEFFGFPLSIAFYRGSPFSYNN
jgi:hypothetical protein